MPQLFLLMPFSWSPFWTSFWQKFPIWPMPVSWCSSFLTRFLAVSGWNPPHDHPLIFDQVGIVPCDHVMMVIRLKQWFFGDKKTQQKATEHSAFPSISHYECSFTNDSTLAAREVIGSGDLPVSIGVSPQQAAIWAPWPSKAPWANSRINSSKSFCTCAVASAFHVVLSYPIGSMYGIYMLTWGVY